MGTCNTCTHWCGTRYSTYADCHWVIGALAPELLEFKDEKGYYFNVPFDPHYRSRYAVNMQWERIYRMVIRSLPDGVRVDRDGSLRFIQTRKDYGCKYYEERN